VGVEDGVEAEVGEGVGRDEALGAAPGAEAAGFAAAAGLGGAGFSGLIPPSQDGPEYISAESPFAFHFSSKSAAALFGDSPVPTTLFQGYTLGPI
jgi:hypothetical protein